VYGRGRVHIRAIRRDPALSGQGGWGKTILVLELQGAIR